MDRRTEGRDWFRTATNRGVGLDPRVYRKAWQNTTTQRDGIQEVGLRRGRLRYAITCTFHIAPLSHNWRKEQPGERRGDREACTHISEAPEGRASSNFATYQPSPPCGAGCCRCSIAATSFSLTGGRTADVSASAGSSHTGTNRRAHPAHSRGCVPSKQLPSRHPGLSLSISASSMGAG